MNESQIRWSYCIAKAGPDRQLEMEFSTGPIPAARIKEILGGEYHISPLLDSTAIAYRTDQSQLPENEHYPGIKGDVLVGKLSRGVFVGALGVMS